MAEVQKGSRLGELAPPRPPPSTSCPRAREGQGPESQGVVMGGGGGGRGWGGGQLLLEKQIDAKVAEEGGLGKQREGQP